MKKLPKNFGQLKDIPEGEDWLDYFNNFLDENDHIVSKGGKFVMKKGKKKKEPKNV